MANADGNDLGKDDRRDDPKTLPLNTLGERTRQLASDGESAPSRTRTLNLLIKRQGNKTGRQARKHYKYRV